MSAARRTTRTTRDVTKARKMVADIRSQIAMFTKVQESAVEKGALDEAIETCAILDQHLERMDARTGKRDPSAERE